MSRYEADDSQGIDSVSDREIAALTEYLTVLPTAPGVFEVVSESGRSYTVDARQGVCSCPDHEYRGIECKHLARVAFETGDRDLPAWVDHDALPADFGAHVDGGGGARTACADGGQIIDAEADVEAKHTFHIEPPAQGGAQYAKCTACGAELLTSLGGAEKMIHKRGCGRARGQWR